MVVRKSEFQSIKNKKKSNQVITVITAFESTMVSHLIAHKTSMRYVVRLCKVKQDTCKGCRCVNRVHHIFRFEPKKLLFFLRCMHL